MPNLGTKRPNLRPYGLVGGHPCDYNALRQKTCHPTERHHQGGEECHVLLYFQAIYFMAIVPFSCPVSKFH
ncbi:hypothetical protein SUGI_0650460, partial [Cryptomeria japonica]